MKKPIRLGIVLLLTLVALLNASIAHAEEITLDKSTYEGCREYNRYLAAAMQIAKENPGEYNLPTQAELATGASWEDEDILEALNANPERARELEEHYREGGGVGLMLGRVGDWSQCRMEQGLRGIADATGLSVFWSDPVGDFVKALMEGNAQLLEMVMTFWMDFSTSKNVNVDANVQGIKNIVAGLTFMTLVASFIIGGWRIAASRRAGLQDGLEETGGVVVKYIVFSTAVVSMAPGALVASDELANAIMANFGVTNGEQVVEMAALQESWAGPALMLVLLIISMAGAAMQLLALIVRVLVFPIMVGLTPLAAASSFSETGRSVLNSLVAGMIAAVVYKPIAALLYAVIFWNVTQDGSGDDLLGAVVNALMIAIAGFAAPALVRMIMPMTAAAGGGSAGGMIAGASSLGAGALGVAAGATGAVGRGLGAVGKAGANKFAASGGGGGGSGGGRGPVSTEATAAGASGGVPAGGASGGGRHGGGGVSTAAIASGASGGGGSSASSGGRSSAGAGLSGGVVAAGARGGRGGSSVPVGARMARAGGSIARGVGRGTSVTARVAGLGFRGASAVASGGAQGLGRAAGAAHSAGRIIDDSIGVTPGGLR